MPCFGSASVAFACGLYCTFSSRALCAFLSAVHYVCVDAGVRVSLMRSEAYRSFFGVSACLEILHEDMSFVYPVDVPPLLCFSVQFRHVRF